jgi:chemotaxis protein MotB
VRLRSRRLSAPNTGRDRWLIPYADLVTLLFAFFTALYAVTAVDASRLEAMTDGLRKAVGSAEAPQAAPTPAPPPAAAEPEPDRGDVSQAREAIHRELSDVLDANKLELIEDRRGLVLAIPEANAFGAGRAELSAQAQVLMARIAAVLASVPNGLRVEGHTDDAPIHTQQFTSNWDLSTARATRVVEFLISRGGVEPDRLSAACYSFYHPRATNGTVEGRARNRRVDIVILNTATRSSEEPAPAAVPLDRSIAQSLDPPQP